MKKLNYKELLEINGGDAQSVGRAIGCYVGCVYHNLGDFFRGVWDGMKGV